MGSGYSVTTKAGMMVVLQVILSAEKMTMSNTPPPVHSDRSTSPPNEPGASWPQYIIFAILLIFVAVILQLTSTPAPTKIKPTSQPTSNPTSEPSIDELLLLPKTQPSTAPTHLLPRDPNRTQVEISSLADQQTGWLQIRQQSAFGKTSTAQGHYADQNEFRIDTVNVEAFTIDLATLPVLKGRMMILHIDGQDMTLTTERQSFIHFRRTAAGIWEQESKQ
ncbi:MAG: hypothetical protein HJJLKODD_00006 [Phycisphaerae bacterium]|nr:hypothetical protein [Phycisphaerae bacterium]